LAAGRPTEAEPLLREALAIQSKSEPDLWTTPNTQSLLGGALAGQNKFADAEPHLVAGYEGLKQRSGKIPSRRRSSVVEALDRLIRACDAAGKPADAAKWRAERETVTGP